FESRDLERSGDDLVVRGELTIRGITKPVELDGKIAGPITDAYGRERINLNVSTSVDRTDFGLNWNVPLPNGEPALANEVKLVAELYLVQEA
ncbi:MAG: YceI family protein, partial [Gaiellaceae bacterium]